MSKPTSKELALAKQLDALQRRYEKRYEKQIYTALKAQLKPYLDAIKQAPGNINRFDIISPAPLADSLESLYVVAGTAYADAMYSAIQPASKATKEQLRAGWRDFMRRFAVTNLSGLLIDINRTSVELIERIVSGGLQQGVGVLDIARTIEQSVTAIFTNRSKLIARTEMVKATNVAAMQSSATSDFMYEKKWIPATDARTRQDHLAMLNKPYIPFDQPFIVGGVEMQQPGAPGAPASQVCNCRCKVVFRIMRDVDGLPMRKLGSQSGAYNFTNRDDEFSKLSPTTQIIRPEPIFTGDIDLINKFKPEALKIIDELGIDRKIEFDFKLSSNQRLGGDVTFVLNKQDNTYRMGNKVVVVKQKTENEFKAFLRHELRHIHQSDKKGFMIKGNNFYYEGEKSISINQYQKILRGAQKGDQTQLQKYLNLPWEKDADNFAGISRKSKVLVGEFFVVDLIQLPIELAALTEE